MKLPAQPYMLPLEANRLTGLFLSAVLFFASTALHAQKQIKEFAFTLPEATITNSLYNSIELMDSRHDTSNFGIVQLGAFNRKVQVVAATPLAAPIAAGNDRADWQHCKKRQPAVATPAVQLC